MGCKIASDHPGLPVALLGGAAFGLLVAADRLFLGRRFNLLETKRLLAGSATVVAFAGVAEAFTWCKGWRPQKELSTEEIEHLVEFNEADSTSEQSFLASAPAPTLKAISSHSAKATESQLYWLVTHATEEQFNAILEPHLNDPEKLVTLFKIAIKRCEANIGTEADLNAQRMEALCRAAGQVEGLPLSVLVSLKSDEVIPTLQYVWDKDNEKIAKLAQACLVGGKVKLDLFIQNASIGAIEALLQADDGPTLGVPSALSGNAKGLLDHLTKLYKWARRNGPAREAACLTTVLTVHEHLLIDIVSAGEKMPFAPLWWFLAAPEAIGEEVRGAEGTISRRFLGGQFEPWEVEEAILPDLIAIIDDQRGEEGFYEGLAKLATSYSLRYGYKQQFDEVMLEVFKVEEGKGGNAPSGALHLIDNIDGLLDIALDSAHVNTKASWADAFMACLQRTQPADLDKGVLSKIRRLCTKLGKQVPGNYKS